MESGHGVADAPGSDRPPLVQAERRRLQARALAPLALQNPRVVYDLLLRTSAQTLQEIARNPKHLGARLGFFAILHTWGQTLIHHPHVHCVVPAGGLAEDGRTWQACRPGFFLPVRVLSRLFRGKFVAALHDAFQEGRIELHGRLACYRSSSAFGRYLHEACRTEWVVYAKPPFERPELVIAYLARYTHRIAISNHRLLHVDDEAVSLRYKDYRSRRGRSLTLPLAEFTRRFLLHVLPRGFVRIRHYGFLANGCRARLLACCRGALAQPESMQVEQVSGRSEDNEPFLQLLPQSLRLCPHCGRGPMRCIELLGPHLPAITGPVVSQPDRWPRPSGAPYPSAPASPCTTLHPSRSALTRTSPSAPRPRPGRSPPHILAASTPGLFNTHSPPTA